MGVRVARLAVSTTNRDISRASPPPPSPAAPSTVLALCLAVLRIQLLDLQDGTVTLQLAGRVAGPWVGELSHSCERILEVGGTLSVDLREVTFVDRAGVQLLRNLRGHQVALVNCSPFVAEQLRASR